MSNGCGCETGVLKWFRPPYARTFYVPCCMHDDAYDEGGTEAERMVADKVFFIRMVRLLFKKRWELAPWRYAWLVFIAYIYYISVRVFGRFYFNYTKDFDLKR